jgi:hypothetical protein
MNRVRVAAITFIEYLVAIVANPSSNTIASARHGLVRQVLINVPIPLLEVGHLICCIENLWSRK